MMYFIHLPMKWNRQWVPKRRQLELRRRGITQKGINYAFQFPYKSSSKYFSLNKDQYISIEHDYILFLNQLHVLDCNKAIIILRTGITNTKLTTVIIYKLRPQIVMRISIILNS